DKLGRRYHALDPDTFYWAHATFFMGTIVTAENFSGGLTEAQKRQLFTEHIQWYRLYGMSMRPVPETWEAFQEYWDHMCRNVLEDNKATRDVLDLSGLGKPPYMTWLPDPLWRLARIPLARGFVWLTVGMYDQPVRDLLGYSWSGRDQRIHTAVGRSVNAVFRLVPWRYRYQPRARAGWDRANGRIPADAPLVHTPARNLPPLEQRDNPMHYSPRV
ncbi:oxygenase MpaB family protein, partial [Rhodococcus sp. (in: high G+C Gram-positive bacteria)]